VDCAALKSYCKAYVLPFAEIVEDGNVLKSIRLDMRTTNSPTADLNDLAKIDLDTAIPSFETY